MTEHTVLRTSHLINDAHANFGKSNFMLHPLLKKQLKKIGLDTEILPETTQQWENFLEKINTVYNDADQERGRLEESLTASSAKTSELYKQLENSETRYALAAKGANDGLWDWDIESDGIYYSERCLEILGIKSEAEESPSRAWWFDRIHPENKEQVFADFTAHLKGETKHFYNEHQVLNAEGKYIWLLVRGLAVRGENGRAYRFVGSLSDITERKLAERKLAFDAIHDSLTNLPNRKFLMERLQRALERSKLDQSYSFAVLFIDLDKFKIINDTMGHQAGDTLLLTVTERLRYAVRPSDMIARLGGDEFVAVVENIKNDLLILDIADRIIRDVEKPVEIHNQKVYTSASIGIAFSSSDYENAEDIVRDADIAMYSAKLKGRGCTELFTTTMHSGAVSLLQIQNDLRHALENNEFVLHYQPIISLDTDKITGFEALIRWNHPVRGMIAPAEFIPVAEETGLILPLGKWVLYEACRQLKQWQREYLSAEGLMISVNLSAVQIEQKDLIKDVSDVLLKTKLQSHNLKLEITESVLMKNKEQAVETVKNLNEMGIQVSIDDFGTGYSSLSYLHNFNISTLKIDRSFINRIECEREKAEIIRTIITLAGTLGIDVVAEGVETEEQLRFLREHHCNFGQGFYYSRPVGKEKVSEILHKSPQNNFEPAASAELFANA